MTTQPHYWPPKNDDTDPMDILPDSYTCPSCNSPANIFSSSAITFDGKLGYRMWRLRIITHCPSCNQYHGYRQAGYIVEQGKYVPNNHPWPQQAPQQPLQATETPQPSPSTTPIPTPLTNYCSYCGIPIPENQDFCSRNCEYSSLSHP